MIDGARIGRLARTAGLAAILSVVGVGAACAGIPAPSALDQHLDFPDVQMLHPQWRRLVVDPEQRAYDPVERSGAAFDPGRGLVFVGTSQGTFWALDSGTGAVAWSIREGDPFGSTPVFVREIGLLLVGNDRGVFRALRPDDGTVAWSADLGSAVRRPPVYADRVAFVRTIGQRVFAFEASTGKELWSYDRAPLEGYASNAAPGLLLDGDRLYTGFDDGTVAALSVISGDEEWRINVAGEGGGELILDDICATPVVAGDVIVAPSYDNGLVGLSRDDGTQRWSRPDLLHVSGLAVVDGDPLIAVAGVGLARLDPEDGHDVWVRRYPAGALSDPVVRNGLIVMTDDMQGLLFFEALTGELLQTWSSGRGIAAPPAVVDGRIAFLDNTGEFHAFYFMRPGFAVP